MDIRVLLESDVESVIQLGRDLAGIDSSGGLESEMKAWSARWREESLRHYLAQGWSYGIEREGELKGFILCQPLLFFRGHTQTLWVEELMAANPSLQQELLEAAYRWARDKHFQVLLLESERVSPEVIEPWLGRSKNMDGLIEIRSTRT